MTNVKVREIAGDDNVEQSFLKALSLLEQEGFIRTIPRRGIYIVRKSKREMIEMIQMWAALESMAARFATWERRFPVAAHPTCTGPRAVDRKDAAGWDRVRLARVRERAARLEADVCRAAGIRPDQVGRLRWTSAALAKAAA